jgi:hypothetical protein
MHLTPIEEYGEKWDKILLFARKNRNFRIPGQWNGGRSPDGVRGTCLQGEVLLGAYKK